MIYIVVYIGLILLNFALPRKGGTRRQAYMIALFALFLFSAFRFEVGCDWTGYLNQFRYPIQFQSSDRFDSRGEPLWWLIINQLRNLDVAYPWLNVVSSAIFFIGVHVLARRQPDPFSFLVLLLPVLIINMPMSGIRQGAAIGVMCVAIAAFMDRKLIRFAGLTVVAAALHSSAIVFLLLIPLVSGSLSPWRVFLAVLLAIPGVIVLINSAAAEVAISRYVDTDIDAAGAAF